VSEITKELRARYQAFRARSLGEVELLVLFGDAIYLPTRPSDGKEGVLVAWGYDETGQRVLLDVVLGPAGAVRGLAGDGARPGPARPAGADAGRHRRSARVDPGDGGPVAGQRSPEVHGAPNP
jgi:Transposase, Mutator family